ncbi:penicillin-binding protein 2 [bacterium]|nr:penicillin-binding protein 2 [bacterium]
MIIILRAFYLQIIDRSNLQKQADNQWNHSISVNLRRGPIYDTDGNLLAVSLPLNSVFAIPGELSNSSQTAKDLASVIQVPATQIQKKLDANVSFVWIERNITPAESEKLKEMDLKGIHFLKEYQRFYPMKDHAAQLLGFSGIDSQGLEGIEYQYNEHLMDNSGHTAVWDYLYESPKLSSLSGGSLNLTIRSKLQYMTEKELRKAVQTMNAKNGVAIIMKSQTGEILSMANIPDYDPNNFDQYPPSRYFNRAVSATYEPGSTFKIITMAAAMDNKVIDKDSIFFCEEGEYQIQDRVIHDVSQFGWLPIKNIIQKSSNICAAKIGQRIPKPIFYKMIREFGFGSKTGITLPGEVSGKVHSYQSWSDTDVATISFGHTISATPIQVLMAINAIATGGILVKPKIVKSAVSANNEILSNESESWRKQILKPETAEIIKGFMVSVTQKGGTGYLARINGVSIAGKTGTSRKFDIRKREYSNTDHITSFVGFFPAENPVFSILVVIDEPQKEYLHSKGAAPVFRKIAQHAMRFYEDTAETQPSFDNSVTEDQNLFFTRETYENWEQAQKSIPACLQGMTLREALAFANFKDLNLEINGSGRVIKTIPINKGSNRYRIDLE